MTVLLMFSPHSLYSIISSPFSHPSLLSEGPVGPDFEPALVRLQTAYPNTWAQGHG